MNNNKQSTLGDFDSFGSAQEGEISPEIEEFYTEFFENNDKLKAEIIGHETLEGNGSKYTVTNCYCSNLFTSC